MLRPQVALLAATFAAFPALRAQEPEKTSPTREQNGLQEQIDALRMEIQILRKEMTVIAGQLRQLRAGSEPKGQPAVHAGDPRAKATDVGAPVTVERLPGAAQPAAPQRQLAGQQSAVRMSGSPYTTNSREQPATEALALVTAAIDL